MASNNTDLSQNSENKMIERRKYELSSENIKYILIIENKNDSFINFYLKEDNDNIKDYFMNKYDNKKIRCIFDLDKNYENSEKIFDYLVDLFDREKIRLEKDETKKGKGMILFYKDEREGYGNSEYEIKLEKFWDKGDIIFQNLLMEIKKANNDNINKLKQHIEFLETKIKKLEEVINLSTQKNVSNNKIEVEDPKKIELKKEEKNCIEMDLESKEEKKECVNTPKADNQNLNEFTENPEDLRYEYCLSKEVTSSENELNNFDVYIGVKDHIYYMVYENLKNNNIEIMNIVERKIIKSLSGHYRMTSVIKYYFNKIEEEYILSCDINSKAIIWDVAKDFEIKYIFRMRDIGLIKDAVLLFDIYKKNYLVISRYNKQEYTKLYELSDNTPCIKEIYKTKKNITNQIIPWIYNNKYYIIELCCGYISIKNILEKDSYTDLNIEDDDVYLSGFIYKDNQLITNISNKKQVLFLDLITKNKIKIISYQKSGYSLCHWNERYSIIIGNSLQIINMEKKEVVKDNDIKRNFYAFKKIKCPIFGEALIVTDDRKSLDLLTIYSK